MVYLYAAMGVMMLTGIIAIFEMGLSITGQSFLSKPEDAYQSNQIDQKMLLFLHTPDHIAAIKLDPSKDLCEKVMNRIIECKSINSPACEEAVFLDNADLDRAEDSRGKKFSGACALQDASRKHRMLLSSDLSKNPQYDLFSCALNGETVCDFEASN